MKQLIFNEEYSEIVEEPISYWKDMSEVPDYIKKYINDTIDKIIVYDFYKQRYLCHKCLRLLDSKFYCDYCSKKYGEPTSTNSKYVIAMDSLDITSSNFIGSFYVFDIAQGNVLLYEFDVSTIYENPLVVGPYRTNHIWISKVYHITEDGIRDLIENEYFSFQEYDENSIRTGDDFKLEFTELFDFVLPYNFLYVDNLEYLKKVSFYKYSSIWELKEYYEKEKFNLASLTCFPIYFKQFEYLIKMKLYRLAANAPNDIKTGRNFKEAFGIDKEYYPVMKEIDINYNELKFLQMYPTKNKDLIKFASDYYYCFEDLVKFMDLEKLKAYFEEQGLKIYSIHEYNDYIDCCRKLGFDLKDKKILFPKKFMEQHDKLFTEMIITTDPMVDERIKNFSNILSLNSYEDDKYIIFPADSVSSLIDESTQQSNCVRTYCEKLSNNECQIYFMRKKENPNKSLVTIEVVDGHIVQARTIFNRLPSKEQNKVLKRWEQSIIPVVNNSIDC